MAAQLRTRLSLRELELKENAGKKNDFLKAWKLMKALPPSNPNSFWSIATYHGMPFKERRVSPLIPGSNVPTWGGYCQHANVLFPTWHRFYCLRLEQALQTMVPEGDVALHYWDETSDKSLENGIPSIVMDRTVIIDGEEVENPLRNFTISKEIPGSDDGSYYYKPEDYTTVRYPYSGIKNPLTAKNKAMEHNNKINGMRESSDELLQENVHHWLNVRRFPVSKDHPNSVYKEFAQCLESPNYNGFSNTTSASLDSHTLQSLEQPHNDVHLMVGGFTLPTINRDESSVPYVGLLEGANGDMGANETASFDPIFFLHHANIDRMFWVWQKKWGHTNNFKIKDEGFNSGTSTDGDKNQGMTPNQEDKQVLGMDTILYPFQNELGVPQTSRDCINIEKQLGYTYSIGSLDKKNWSTPSYKEERTVCGKVKFWNLATDRLKKEVKNERKKKGEGAKRAFFDCTKMKIPDPQTASIPMFVKGGERPPINVDGTLWKLTNFIKVDQLDKDAIGGSFVIQAFHEKNGKKYFIGQRGVLDRWERQHCLNCRRHRETAVSFNVDGIVETPSDMKNLRIYLVCKDPSTGEPKIFELEGNKHPYTGKMKANKVPRIRFITEAKLVG